MPFENRFNADGLANEIYDLVTGTMTGVPTDLKKAIRDCFRPTNHAHVALVQFAELAYARRDVLPANVLDLAAQAAETAGVAGLAGMNGRDRGVRIAAAIRKNAAVPKPPAAPTTDPEPSAQFQPPPPPPPPPPA